MGLLDLPAPLFGLVDRVLLSPLPPLLRLILWAIAMAVLSLTIYRLLSPQRRIAETKNAAAEARRRLQAHDGDLESALPLLRNALGLSLRQIGLVLPAALVASLPVLALLVWLDTTYGYELPSGQSPAVQVEPHPYVGRWLPGQVGARIEVSDPHGAKIGDLAITEPVTRIERRHWWNVIVGNPAGYLPSTGPVEGVSIALPERQYLSVGPDWLRSWVTIALSALMIASILFMRLARIA